MNKPCQSSAWFNEEKKEFYVNMNDKVWITDARVLIAECLKCQEEIRSHCNKWLWYLQWLMMNKK
jgi:hypothetical protein